MSNNIYVEEYIRVLRNTVDPEATVDSDGNVVYVDNDGAFGIIVKTVSPEECERVILEMYGGNIGC